MNYSTILLLLTLIVNTSHAQHQVGAQIEFGVSGTSDKYESYDNSLPNQTNERTPKLSTGFGITHEYLWLKTFGYQIGLAVTQMNSQQEISEYWENPTTNIFYTTTVNEDLKLTYLTVPILLRFKLNKIRFGIGIRSGMNLINSGSIRHQIQTGEEPATVILDHSGDIGLSKIDIGPIVNFDFLIKERLYVGLNAYASANESNYNLSYGYEIPFRNLQANLTLRYIFIKDFLK
jgi:hypothetical protein